MAQSLERRVAALEKQVAELKAEIANGRNGSPGRDDWKKTIGMFTGDSVMREVFDEAMRLREKDREKARRRYAKARSKR